jgi:Alpha/beta hydrolase domain
MRRSRKIGRIAAALMSSATIALTATALTASALTSPALAAPERTVPPLPTLPTVSGPIPVTAQSRPFLSADPAVLEAVGYVEEEYFLTGQANTYEWDGDSGKVRVVAGPGIYTNRILVRRPKAPARFSGNIEINLLNASTFVDRGFPLGFERMAAAGDAWIGITTKSLTVGALKRFDPQRYAPLNWNNPAPVDQRCQEPSIIPLYSMGNIPLRLMPPMMRDITQEDGLVWDMIGQLGLLLKGEKRSAILPEVARPKLFLTGISQSALMLNTWMVAFHDRYRMADGKPVFDGYLSIVGANILRIAQCSVDIPAQDPRSKTPVLDVPVIKIYSEAEMNYGRYSWRPDVIMRRSGVVTYEIAGATHARGDIPGKPRVTLGEPSSADMAKSLPGFPQMPRPALPAGAVTNDFPWAITLRAAYLNLEQWANMGIAPPSVPRIKLDASLEIVRDADGNTLGGLRLPYIDVPTAHYVGSLASSGMMSIVGAKTPFDDARLTILYGDHAGYLRKFTAATDAALAARLILPDDARDMKIAAAETDVP